MKFTKSYISLNLVLLIIGMLLPFISELVVIEMFFLLIPIGTYIIIFLMILLSTLVFRKRELRNRTIIFLIPVIIFLLSQIASVKIVDTYLKSKSENLISEIENYKITKKEYPRNLSQIKNESCVKYKLITSYTYELRYERGFMVSEIYNSGEKTWRSYGWND